MTNEHRLYFDSGNIYVDGELYKKLKCAKFTWDVEIISENGDIIRLNPVGGKDHLLLFISHDSFLALGGYK